MRRRLIPLGFFLVALVFGLTPFYAPFVDDQSFNLITAIACSIVFGFKSGLFGWMRQTMVTDSRRLTVFGVSLKDFFLALVILAGTFAFVFATTSWYAYQAIVQGLPQPPGALPRSFAIIVRAGVLSGSVLILGTGLAVAYEMRRAGAKLAVHEEKGER